MHRGKSRRRTSRGPPKANWILRRRQDFFPRFIADEKRTCLNAMPGLPFRDLSKKCIVQENTKNCKVGIECDSAVSIPPPRRDARGKEAFCETVDFAVEIPQRRSPPAVAPSLFRIRCWTIGSQPNNRKFWKCGGGKFRHTVIDPHQHKQLEHFDFSGDGEWRRFLFERAHSPRDTFIRKQHAGDGRVFSTGDGNSQRECVVHIQRPHRQLVEAQQFANSNAKRGFVGKRRDAGDSVTESHERQLRLGADWFHAERLSDRHKFRRHERQSVTSECDGGGIQY